MPARAQMLGQPHSRLTPFSEATASSRASEVGPVIGAAARENSVIAAAVRDTAVGPQPTYTGTHAWMAAGFLVGIAAFAPFDEQIAVWSQSSSAQSDTRTKIADVFNWWGVPGTIIVSVGTYGAGRLAGSRHVSELGLRATEALAISAGITGIVKGLTGRQRPYVDIHDPSHFVFGKGFTSHDNDSFPSGHATAAFAFAAVVTDETAHWWPHQTWWVGTLTYGSATMVGLSRIYSNKHWSSDVVAGAMVGTLSGLGISRWHRAHPNSKLDRWLLPGTVTATSSGLLITWTRSY